MSDSIKTKTLIFAVIMGFIMALYSTARADIDAGPEIAALSAADASAIEVPNDESGVAGVAEAEATAEESAVQSNPAKEDPIGTGTAMIQAFKDGAWLVGFGLALLFAVFLIRSGLIFFKVKWAKTKPGGFIIAFGTSGATVLGLAFSTGVGFSFALAVGAAGAAWVAAGQVGHINDVIDWLRGKPKPTTTFVK